MHVTMMMAVTADGLIATDPDHAADWTSTADKKSFVEETKKAGVVIFGRTTYDTINRPLAGRLIVVMTTDPAKYADRAVANAVEFTALSPTALLADLEKKGHQAVVVAGGAKTNGAFLAARLVDEIILTIEPKLFGRGLNFTEGADLDVTLKLLSVTSLNDDAIQLRYQVVH